MNSIKRFLRRLCAAELLIVLAVTLSTPLFSLSQEKQDSPPAKAPSGAPPQKSGAACGKTATEAQVSGLAAKIREFQAKQQAKNNKNQPKDSDQATNRKP
jgi:hypothetical protein